MRHQIMSKRSLLGDVAHEHGDGAANGLIDVDNEHLLIVPKENCAPAAGRQNCPHLHLDHRFVHAETVRVRTGNTSSALDTAHVTRGEICVRRRFSL